MSNKSFIQFILLLFFLTGCASAVTRKINNKIYTQVNGKDRFIFFKEKGKYRYIQYKLDKKKSYTVNGYLEKVSEMTFVTHGETIQSILVDSLLNEVTIGDILKSEIKENLKHDSLFFSIDYKDLIYNNQKFILVN